MRTHQGPDLPYSVVAGVVPISAGWLVASAKLRGATFAPEESRLFDSFREVIDVRPSFSIVVLNVPIGYVDEPGTAQRSCDLEAQALLGGHSLALPPALTRASLFAGGDIDSGPHLDEDDYRFERYREVALEMSPSSQRIVYEGRPELSFYQLNNYEALRWSGESEQGREERRGILERKVPGVTRVLDADMPGVDRRELHDVAALLWTARRVFGHSAGRLPSEGEWDSEGLRMELVM